MSHRIGHGLNRYLGIPTDRHPADDYLAAGDWTFL
jgi:hypothetical protein